MTRKSEELSSRKLKDAEFTEVEDAEFTEAERRNAADDMASWTDGQLCAVDEVTSGGQRDY